MLQATDAFAVNLGFLGKGNASLPAARAGQRRRHWPEAARRLGTTPAAISNCLDVADELDMQVAIHSDTPHKSGFVEDTVAATKKDGIGRSLYAFHTEGADGGHAPDILRVVGETNFFCRLRLTLPCPTPSTCWTSTRTR